jgi:hypothetical protein
VSPLPKKVSSRQIVSLGLTIWYLEAWDPDMRWIGDIITWMHVLIESGHGPGGVALLFRSWNMTHGS